MADISYKPKFNHTDWIDGESIVQASGENGMNIRFHGCEQEFGAIATTFGVVNTMIGNLQQLQFLTAQQNVSVPPNASSDEKLVDSYDRTAQPANIDKTYFCLIFPLSGLNILHTFLYHPEAPNKVRVTIGLSFPLLISAVPLYARDRTMTADEGRKLRLCLFSDGGLSSNFPIHFFDSMLPNSPTFAISLDEYDVRRDRAVDRQGETQKPVKETRVWMPPTDEAGGGILLPNQPFNGIVEFFSRLIDAAKDWQDNLQSTLAGYRDRIVHVYLKPEEGGLNIAMPPELIVTLGEYGAKAGEMLRDDFSLDEHRWRRFLVAMDRLDQTLRNFVDAYQGRPSGAESFGAFLARYPQIARSFKQTVQDRATLLARATGLVELSKFWLDQPEIPDTKLPHPKTDLRITPKP